MRLNSKTQEYISLSSSILGIIGSLVLIPAGYIVLARLLTYEGAVNITRATFWFSVLALLIPISRNKIRHWKWRFFLPLLFIVILSWIPVNFPVLSEIFGGRKSSIETIIRSENTFINKDEKYLLYYFTTDAIITVQERVKPKEIGGTWRGFAKSGLHNGKTKTIVDYYDYPFPSAYRKVIPDASTIISANGQNAVAISYTQQRENYSFFSRSVTLVFEILKFWEKPTGGWKDFRWSVWKFKLSPTFGQWKIREFRGGFTQSEIQSAYEELIKNIGNSEDTKLTSKP